MAQPTTSFQCSSCSFSSSKWYGCCPRCSAWHTFEETGLTPEFSKLTSASGPTKHTSIKLITAANIPMADIERMETGIHEWDRVTGGGILPGAFVMLTGDPGIGKSTLLLQVAHALAASKSVCYFSCEESLTQVRHRLERLRCATHPIYFSDCAQLADILESCKKK